MSSPSLPLGWHEVGTSFGDNTGRDASRILWRGDLDEFKHPVGMGYLVIRVPVDVEGGEYGFFAYCVRHAEIEAAKDDGECLYSYDCGLTDNAEDAIALADGHRFGVALHKSGTDLTRSERVRLLTGRISSAAGKCIAHLYMAQRKRPATKTRQAKYQKAEKQSRTVSAMSYWLRGFTQALLGIHSQTMEAVK